MKFKAKITTGLIAIFATIVAVFTFAWFGNKEIKASADPTGSATAGTVDVWYKTYTPENYEKLNAFYKYVGLIKYYNEDEDMLVSIKTVASGAAAYDYFLKLKSDGVTINFDSADKGWSCGFSSTSSNNIKMSDGTSAENAFGGMPRTLWGNNLSGFSIAETTTFERNDTFVLLVYARTVDLNCAELWFDETFDGIVQGTGASYPSSLVIQSNATSLGASSANETTGVYGTEGTKKLIKVGFDNTPTSFGTSKSVLLGGLILTVKGDATTGTHTIQYNLSDKSQVTPKTGNYKAQTNSSAFNQATQTITIKASTNMGGATAKSVTGTTNTFTASETSTGQTSGTVTYDLWTVDDIYSPDSSSNISTDVEIAPVAGGSIERVGTVATSAGGAISNLPGSDSAMAADAKATVSSVSLAFNTPKYVAVKINGSYYVIKFERKAFTDNLLTNFSNLTTNSTTSNTATISPAFASGTNLYNITVSGDATQLNFDAAFDNLNKGTTAKLNDSSALSSGVSSNVTISSGNSFTIDVYSQAGVKNTYTFSVVTLSSDNSLGLSVSGVTGITGTWGTPVSGTPSKSNTNHDVFTVSGLRYSDNSFNYTFTIESHAKVYTKTTSAGAYALVSSNNGTFSITNPTHYNQINAGDQTLFVKVEAENGVSKEYELTFVRTAADTDATLSALTATATGGGAITLDSAFAAATLIYNSQNDVDYTVPSYTVNATSTSDYAKIKINTGAATTHTGSQLIPFSGVSASTPACSIVVTAENPAYSQTYTLNITREAADTDASITLEEIYGKDALGNTVYGYDASGNPVITSTGWVTSFADQYGFDLTGAALENNSTKMVPTSIKSIVFKVKLVSSKSTLKISGTDYNDQLYTKPLAFVTNPGGQTTESILVYTQASPTTPTTYTFRCYTEAVSINSYLTSITVTGVQDSSVTNTKTFGPSDYSYAYQMEAAKNSQYSLNVVKASTKSEVYYATTTNAFNGGVGASTFTATKVTGWPLQFAINPYNTTSKLYLYVVAEAGGTYATTYDVDVRETDTRETDNEISNIIISSVDNYSNETVIFNSFVQGTTSMGTVTVGYDITRLKFDVTLSGSHSTLTTGTNGYDNIHAIVGGVDTPKTYSFQATAENGSLGSTYSISIVRKAPKTGNAITALTVSGNAADDTNGNSYVFGLGRNNLSPSMAITVSDGATFSVTTAGGTTSTTSPVTLDGLANGTYQVATISVLSEKDRIDGGSAKTYNVYVINADRSNSIDNIQMLDTDEFGSDLLDSSGNAYVYNSAVDTNPISITYGANNPYFKVTNTTTPNSEISGDGAQTVGKSTTSTTTKRVTISSLSEFGKILKTISSFTSSSLIASETVKYVYNFSRAKASNVNTLEELSFTFNGGAYTGSVPTSYNNKAAITALTASPVKFENLTSTASVTITYKKTDGTSEVLNLTDADPMNQNCEGDSLEVLGLASNTTKTVTLRVKAEDGTMKKWEFIFAYSTVVLDSVGTTKKITVEGDVESGDKAGFRPAVLTYPISLSGKNTSAKIVVTPDSANATVTIDGNSYTADGTPYLVPLTPGNTEHVTVLVVSQDGSAQSSYTLDIECRALETDSSLKGITQSEFDATNWSSPANVSGFTPTGLSYTINVKNNITQFKLTPTTNVASAKVVSNNANPMNLQVGDNTAQVVVEAEDGTQTTYEFKIIKDDSTKLDNVVISKPTNSTNLIDFADPSSYVFDVEYAVSVLDFSYHTVGKNDNLKLETKLNGTNNATTVNVESDGTATSTGQLALANPGTYTFTITVIAKSNELTTYTFKITRKDGNSSNYIETYEKEDATAYSGKTKSVTVNSQSVIVIDNSETIEYLLPRSFIGQTFDPTIKVTDGTVTDTFPDGFEIVQADKTFKEGRNPFTLKLYAENGDVRQYNVVVIIADSFGSSTISQIIKNVTLDDYITFDPDQLTYKVNIPYSVNTSKLTVELKDITTAKVKANGTELSKNVGKYSASLDTNESKTYNVVVESEYYQYKPLATETRTITIEIIKGEPNRDTELKELTLQVGTETYNLVYENTTGNITKITPSDNVRVSGNDFTISHLGDSIASFSVKAVPNKAYPLTSLNGATYNADKTEANVSVTIDPDSYNHSTSITVYDEEGKNPNVYNIILFRGAPVDPKDDNSIISVELYDSTNTIYIDKDHGFSESVLVYKLDTAAFKGITYGVGKSYTLVAGINAGSKAKVYIDGAVVQSMTKQYQIKYPTETSEISYARAEDDQQAAYYNFNVASSVTQANYQNYYIYDADVDKYIQASVYGKYDATATYYSKSAQTGVTQANYSQFYIVDDDYVKYHTIQAESDNGDKGKLYTILVVAKAATIDATLADLKVDGSTVTGFDPKDLGPYNLGTISYADGERGLLLYTLPNNENATVKVINSGTNETVNMNDEAKSFSLEVGDNTFSIIVTAEDGQTTKTYSVKVKRDYPDPKLANLVLEGEKLYDSTLKYETPFDEDVYVYYSKVNYSTTGVNITATLKEENAKYTISQSNNVTALNKSGVTRTFAVLPQVGPNRYSFTVISTVGKQTTYVLYITRSEKVSSSTEIGTVNVGVKTGENYPKLLDELVDPKGNSYSDINALGNDLLEANNGTKTSFGKYLLPNDQTSLPITLELAATLAGVDGAEYELINNENLKVGDNTIIARITSADGSQTQTLLIDVYRAPYEYDIKIDEISEFDHKNILEDGYTVAADIEKLNIKVTDKNPATNKIVEHKLISGETLDFGENDVILQVTSYVTDEKGSKIVDNVETFTFKVNRENYDFTVLIEEIESFKDDYKAKEVSSRVPYEVDADATKLNVEAFIEKDNVSTDLEYELVINNKITNLLNFGTNEVTLVVKLPDGKTEKPVSFKVNRPQYDLTVAKDEKELLSANLVLTVRQGEKESQLIPSTENGIEIKSSPQYLADITVPSNVTKIGAEVLKVSGMDNAKVKILTEGYLPLKTSVVEFEIVSEDGATTKHYSVLVTRNPMKYDVVTPDPLFELAKDSNREGYYTLKLDTKPATIIDDYLKAIKFNPNQDDLLVEVLSEVTADTNEVILKVTNNQNPSEVEFVHLNIETTATNSGSLFDILFWIILGISIILLIIILICVNRDKYGSVSKNRKRA